MLDRRTFLSCLGFGTVAAAAAATGAIDVERLLWKPGERTIFIPPPPKIEPIYTSLSKGDVFTIEGRYAINPRTYQPTGNLQWFTVTADVHGETVTAEKLWPQIIIEGPYQNTTGKKAGRFIDSRLITPLRTWA